MLLLGVDLWFTSAQRKLLGAFKTSSQLEIADLLRSQGHEVVCSAEPGGTAIGQKIRTLVRGIDNQEMSDITGMMLFAAARAQNVHEIIKPALERGAIVLLDRFSSSSAFQVAGQGMSAELVASLDSIARDGVSADYTVIFDLDPRVGMARTTKRGECDDKFELMDFVFMDRVRTDFLRQAEENPTTYGVIDASKTYPEVLAAAMQKIQAFLESSGAKAQSAA